MNKIKPSVDTLTHAYLYINLKNVISIIHTHSKYATILAQGNVEPECLGTTHADFFSGKIPLSNKISVVDKNNHEFCISEQTQYVKQISYQDGMKMAESIGAEKYIECSALINKSIEAVFETAAKVVLSKLPTYIKKRSCLLL